MNENDINQQYDRITQMLQQSVAKPIDYSRYAIANADNAAGYSQAVQGETDRRQQTQGTILQLFEAQKARGDKQAQALDDKINLFTGGDPEGTALILDQLHADPENIDPSNSYQVMTKIAGIVKKSGYKSPEQEFVKQKRALELGKDRASIAASNRSNQPAVAPFGAPAASATAQDGGVEPPMANGADFLKTLPPQIGDQVKALAEGRMQFPSGFALKSPYWQQMLQAVSAYDPNFDAVNYNARAKTRADFTSGKSAQNITALNTAIGHLDTLNSAFDDLGNGDYPMLNKATNYLGTEFGNKKIQEDTTKVGAAAHAVSAELAKVFRSVGMAEADIQAWEKKISTASTPAQSKAIIGQALDLMNSRLEAIGSQYDQGMGTTSDPMQLLSPHAQDAYTKLKNGDDSPSAKVIKYDAQGNRL